jgi:Tol biopolymer transport system component
MNRRLVVLGLVLMLTGCTGANTPSDRPSQAGATGRSTLPPAALQSPQPASMPTPFPTPRDTATTTESPGRQGVVAYPLCIPNEAFRCRMWVVNDDGSGAHELLSGAPGSQWPLGWSLDGSRLYYYFEWGGLGPNDGSSGVAVTDAAGSRTHVLFDAGNPYSSRPRLCPRNAHNCGMSEGMPILSPDGTRLAYVLGEGDDLEISTLVVLDIRSGQLMPLWSTRTRNPRVGPNEGPNEPCTSDHGGYNWAPQWSPDGTALVFTRLGCHNAVFTVLADDTGLRELAPLAGEWDGSVFPRWSPDSERIVFAARAAPLDRKGVPELEAVTTDVHTIRPDGTGQLALTSDGVSALPSWTRDGQIVFIRLDAADWSRGDPWIMDPDGGHAAPLETTVPALTAAGCVACPLPLVPDADPRNPGRRLRPWEPGATQRLWQPVQEDLR